MSQPQYDRMVIMEAVAKISPTFFGAVTTHRNRCILACNITQKVFSYFGIESKPTPIWIVAGNHEWVKWVEEAGGLDKVDGNHPEGSWSICAGSQPDGDGYNGHLVLRVEEGLFDPDFQQFHKPEFNIGHQAGALWMMREDRIALFDAGEPISYEPDWGLVILRHIPERDQWKHAPDWKRNYKQSTGQLIRAIKTLHDIPAPERARLLDSVRAERIN